MRIAVVFGTRPEIIKLAPVIKEIEKRKIDSVLIHTGQHSMEGLLKDLSIKNFFDLKLEQPPEA